MKTPLRPEVAALLKAFLAKTQPGDTVLLDDLGNSVGDMAITPDEIGALVDGLTAERRVVTGKPLGSAIDNLRLVLDSTRRLEANGNPNPSVEEVALGAGISPDAARQALAMARVMAQGK